MPTLEQVLELYPQQVRIAFKHFPIKSHKFAKKAAMASIAADRQGKFWAFHDRLFENFNDLGDDQVDAIGKALQLDPEAFEVSLKDPEVARTVQRDQQDGLAAGVRGTPAIFVNGRRLKRRGVRDFSAAIEKALKRAKRTTAGAMQVKP